jgi:opacity protein-like surface antigen
VQFVGFGERARFQDQLAVEFAEIAAATDSVNKADTTRHLARTTKQDFQKTNFAFPVSLGLQYRFNENHSLAAGASFLYNDESVVISDSRTGNRERHYTLQAFPAFLEYRLSISENLVNITGASGFSILARWIWLLPGTEIYSSWGSVKAKTQPWGNGFGIALGYTVASWEWLRIFGEIGFTSVTAKSEDPWSQVVPEPEDEPSKDKKASWDLGGLELKIRLEFP